MPLDYDMMQDAYIGALADFERWKMEWERQFYAPVMQAQAQAVWMALTPQQRAALMANIGPEAYEGIRKFVEGGV